MPVTDFMHEPPCCEACGLNETWCTCPSPVYVNRPNWKDSYPPLYCMICATPMFTLPHLKAMAPQMTCSDVCKEEFERRYYSGTILQKPYAKKP